MLEKTRGILLRTGEMLDAYSVRAPDDHYERDIRSFLPRYAPMWLWHLHLSLRGQLDELESRFYLGLLKDRIVSNVSTWKSGPIGIVGHLFTDADQRGKGACTELMKTAMDDFLSRGGKTLIGGFKLASCHIARRLGFKSVVDNCEVMRYDSAPDFVKTYFQAQKTRCRDALWKDWPGISLLYTTRDGWNLRSIKHAISGPFDYEDYFLKDMRKRLKGLCKSKVLVTERDYIVGHATLNLSEPLGRKHWLLDMFVHPASLSQLDTMLDALDWPEDNVRCYVETGLDEKRNALQARGFREKGVSERRVKGKTLRTTLMELEAT